MPEFKKYKEKNTVKIFARIASVCLLLVIGLASLAFGQAVKDVQVVNTPNVSVSNTPNVNVANTPSVNVANTPAVTVANTPSVNIKNTNAQPVVSSNMDDPGRIADSSEIDQHSSAKPISVPVIPIRRSERSDAGDVDCGGSDRNRQGTSDPQRSGGWV